MLGCDMKGEHVATYAMSHGPQSGYMRPMVQGLADIIKATKPGDFGSRVRSGGFSAAVATAKSPEISNLIMSLAVLVSCSDGCNSVFDHIVGTGELVVEQKAIWPPGMDSEPKSRTWEEAPKIRMTKHPCRH